MGGHASIMIHESQLLTCDGVGCSFHSGEFGQGERVDEGSRSQTRFALIRGQEKCTGRDVVRPVTNRQPSW
jgi:hypothetical protein